MSELDKEISGIPNYITIEDIKKYVNSIPDDYNHHPVIITTSRDEYYGCTDMELAFISDPLSRMAMYGLFLSRDKNNKPSMISCNHDKVLNIFRED